MIWIGQHSYRIYSACSCQNHSQPMAGVLPTSLQIITQGKIMIQQQFQSCVEACNLCADACDFCAISCLQEADPKAMARCIALDIDCAQLCRLAAGYMARNSEAAQDICRVCAEICERCQEECARHQMQHCQECAQACGRCAEECRRMSSQSGQISSGVGSGMAAH